MSTALAVDTLDRLTATRSRVAVYGRVSKRKAGDGKGAYVKIGDQHEATWNRVGPEFPGATPVWFQDNMSAWDPAVVRPDWERMLEGIRAGQFVAVAAWAGDRLTRQPPQLEDLWAACQATGTQLWTLHGGHITSALMLRILGAVAAEESDNKSNRAKLKHARKAADGQFHGGRRRYGYTDRMDATVESEAAVIRDIAARVLAGSTLFSIAADLRAREIPTAQGGKWTGPNLGLMLKREHLAGIRIHKGIQTAATWPAILDRPTWERLQLVLGDKERRLNPGSNARVYLLAGWATCAECGGHLRGRPGTKRNPGRRAYACLSGRHCYRAVVDVDQAVVTRVVRRLSRMTAAGLVNLEGTTDELADKATARKALTDRLAEYADAAATMSPAAYAAATTGIERELAKVDKAMAELEATQARPMAALEGMTGPGAADAWEAADLGRKRAVLAAVCESVQLVGAATSRAPFNPDQDVLISWKAPTA